MKDLIQGSSSELNPGSLLSPQKVIVFCVAFGIAAALSLTYSFSRPAIYQSSAKFLTSAAAGFDQVGAYDQIRHVVIQQQILLSQELLEETLRRLNNSNHTVQMDISQLRRMLKVQPVSDVQLLEMQAEGEEPKLLPWVINTWIDVYLDAHAAEPSKIKNVAVANIKATLNDLEKKIEDASVARDQFARDQAIKSAIREQDETKTRIRGLISSYSNAKEEEIKAKAQLDAILNAIINGEIIAPPQDNPEIINLQQRLQNLKDKQGDIDLDNYRLNIALQPSLKMIPEEIKKLENEIEVQRLLSIKKVRSNAERRYYNARQASITLRKQLAEQKKLIDHYTNILAQHEKFKRAVEDLEKTYRGYQEQMVRAETQQQERYPFINIVARAQEPSEPIRPNYQIDAWLALFGSIIFGLMSVWINGIITRQPSSQSESALLGHELHHPVSRESSQALSQKSHLPKTHHPENEKEQLIPTIRVLADNELLSLLESANSMSKQLISLLLCGLSLAEVSHLAPKDFNKHTQTINIAGVSPRKIELPYGLSRFFERSGLFPVWYTGQAFPLSDLSVWLTLTALDSGVANPEELSPLCLRHTCIIHLLKKGLRLSELEKVVGFLNPVLLLSYAKYAPSEAGHSITEIDRFHPVLVKYFNEK